MGIVIDSTYAPGISNCRAAGVTGVIRYISGGGSWKHASKSEVQSYLAAGISVGLINQHGTNTSLGGYSLGAQHALEGLAAARYVLGHEPRCLYLAVDFDASSSQVTGPIADYFRGGRDALKGTSTRLGIYGGYRPVHYIVGSGIATYGWQAAAWSGGSVTSHAAILQKIAQRSLGPGKVDVNVVYKSDWGQYPYAGAVVKPPAPSAPPTPPKPAPPYNGPWIDGAEQYFDMV